MSMWSGIKTLDKLRSEAAASPTGIKVSIEQLNEIKNEIEKVIIEKLLKEGDKEND